MPELKSKSLAQEQQEQKIETRTAVERIAGRAHRRSFRLISKAGTF